MRRWRAAAKSSFPAAKGWDTEAVLLPVDDTPPVQPVYLTPGMPVAVKVEKGKWYKVGVNLENSGDEALRVFVKVRGAEVRIE